MPIYEYLCKKCGEKFEYLHKRMNEPAPACPKCGAKSVEKQLSVFSAGKENESSGNTEPPCARGGKCAGSSCPFA